MKKLIVTILTLVFALSLAFGVVGCGGDSGASDCQHKLSSTYTSVDNEYHKAKCTICKEYVQEKHKWAQGVDEGDGTKTYNCSKCGDTKSDRE